MCNCFIPAKIQFDKDKLIQGDFIPVLCILVTSNQLCRTKLTHPIWLHQLYVKNIEGEILGKVKWAKSKEITLNLKDTRKSKEFSAIG